MIVRIGENVFKGVYLFFWFILMYLQNYNYNKDPLEILIESIYI